MPLSQIQSAQIERFKAQKVEEGLKPKSINNYLTVLRKSLVVAHEWGLLQNVPMIRWMKAAKPGFDFLDFDEASRLVAAADEEWRPMIVLGLKTGLRLGELRALRWEDVDLDARRLMVTQAVARGRVGTPKSNRQRWIPLCTTAVEALRRHRHLRGELVFCKADGSMYKRNEAKHPLWRACKRAGLRKIGWHCLRHTFASHLVMTGVPLKAVQELLGHSTIDMTMRYAHLSPDVTREAVARLDGIDGASNAARWGGRGTGGG
jgi:integrase